MCTETTDYDSGLRLKQVKHKFDALPEQIVSFMDYTVKNQVQTKRMGKVGTLNYLQKVDYQYNNLGWLTGINNTAGLSASAFTSGTVCSPSQLVHSLKLKNGSAG